MKAGLLNSRCNLQVQSVTQDDLGQPLTTWADVALVWANIMHISGVSAVKAGMDTSSVKTIIRIRYMAGLNAGMRVTHGADIYSIEAVITNKPTRTIDLICKAENATS